jgi:hypothetical protein
MQKFAGLGLCSLLRSAGLATLSLMVLIGLTMNTGRAQTSFATAQVLSGDWGSVTFDNTGVIPDVGYLGTAGFAPHAPLWYQWTAPQDGEVELDTVGSVALVTNIVFNPSTLLFTTNVLTRNLDTVLGVYTGTSPALLNQVAANDDLFPISSSIPQVTEGASADYIHSLGTPLFPYVQPYYGPSHLRFSAIGGATYYFVIDTKALTGPLVFNWAYKSSGVFRFATEDFDFTTSKPLYQTSQTESQPLQGTLNDVNSALLTYYDYNVPGVLVTVNRSAGSTGRVTVDYSTEDGTSLSALPTGDVAAVAGTDYTAVSGTLTFDDFEMSKTILVPILYPGLVAFDQTNRVFGVVLSNPQYDPYESGDVSQPRVDPLFSTAIVKILNANADPYGPDYIPVVVTNIVPIFDTNVPPNIIGTTTNVMTNLFLAAFPTNVIFNFEKADYRVPEDVNRTVPPASPWPVVTLYVERFGTNTAAATLNYRINNLLGNDQDASEEQNNLFPLQPGSDYAVPTPQTVGVVRGTNSDFNMVEGTITFPATGAGSALQKITFTVTNSALTKFNKDFKIQLYREVSVGGHNVPELVGMNNEATVTVLFNDQNPPAGSVDEFYNADFNSDLALDPSQLPLTSPPNDSNPGVSGEVFGLAVWTNNETVLVGNFPSYNGTLRNCVASAAPSRPTTVLQPITSRG